MKLGWKPVWRKLRIQGGLAVVLFWFVQNGFHFHERIRNHKCFKIPGVFIISLANCSVWHHSSSHVFTVVAQTWFSNNLTEEIERIQVRWACRPGNELNICHLSSVLHNFQTGIGTLHGGNRVETVCKGLYWKIHLLKTKKLKSVAIVHKRTIPTKRLPLVSANLCR
jgi:hypothetical protein